MMQNPETQASAPAQGAAFGCFATHAPASQNPEVHFASLPQLIPFG